MKVIIQRVKEASVKVDGKVVSAIKEGLLCLVGIGRDDTQDDAKWMSNKLLSLRLWPNANEKPWQESVKTRGCEVLLVSQFTLHAILKGNKPDFSHSMRPDEAKIFFDDFVKSCQQQHVAEKVKAGVFGANMDVQLVNDGPVTIPLDTELVHITRKPAKATQKPKKGKKKAPKGESSKTVKDAEDAALKGIETLTFPSQKEKTEATPKQ